MKITEEHIEFWINMEEQDAGELIAKDYVTCVAAGLAKGWVLLDMERDPQRALFTPGDDVLFLVCNEDGEGPYACEVS